MDVNEIVAKFMTALIEAGPQMSEIGLETARIMAISQFTKSLLFLTIPFIAFYMLPILFRNFLKDKETVDKDLLIMMTFVWVGISVATAAKALHVLFTTSWVMVAMGMFRPEIYLAHKTLVTVLN